MIDLSQHMDAIARCVLGTPNAKLSKPNQLRFGTRGSLAVEIGGAKRGAWYDQEQQVGGGPIELLSFKGGIANGEVADWLLQNLGIDVRPRSEKPRIAETYDYRAENGDLLYQAVRFDPKDFKQRRPNGTGGWVWKLATTRRVLYRLPELIATIIEQPIYIAEGEKDVESLRALGLSATCNSEGAGKWKPVFAGFFRGRDVVVLPDNDDAGRQHAQVIAANVAPVANSLRIVELPELAPKGDVSDWLNGGGTRYQLEALATAAAIWSPPDDVNVDNIHIDLDAALAEPPAIDPRAPFSVAKMFLMSAFTADDIPILHHHRAAFYTWTGAAYIELGEPALRARLYPFLDGCVVIDAKGEAQPVKPNAAMVGNVLDGLRAAAHLANAVSPPAWLVHVPDAEAIDIIACANGLLHLPTLSLLRHSPQFFTLNALDFDYRRQAIEPADWLSFLRQLWPDDQQAIETLQELFGYCLVSDTGQQKAFLIVGPKRSGKGTIARVLARLIGVDNTVAPTLAGLGMNFGLAPLIGKRVAIISDARLGGRADQHAIAERILSITGEDAITIDRKFMPAWTGRMQTRFVILSNELPRLADASGALAARFVVLMLTNSFYGREDPGLTDRLLQELPGILNWSIAGLQRLRDRGYFVQPASAAEAVQELEDLGSPIGAFLRERCIIAAGRIVEANRLFEIWAEWCKTQGRDNPGTVQMFGRDLRAALPALHTSNLRDGEGRVRVYEGLGLR